METDMLANVPLLCHRWATLKGPDVREAGGCALSCPVTWARKRSIKPAPTYLWKVAPQQIAWRASIGRQGTGRHRGESFSPPAVFFEWGAKAEVYLLALGFLLHSSSPPGMLKASQRAANGPFLSFGACLYLFLFF